METTVMRNMTPMQTPSMVKKLLSFCTRMVWRASRMASKKGMEEPNGRGFRIARGEGWAQRTRFARLPPHGLLGSDDTTKHVRAWHRCRGAPHRLRPRHRHHAGSVESQRGPAARSGECRMDPPRAPRVAPAIRDDQGRVR